ncbi:MAG: flagellar motor switch protein FliN [Deltaproteobacteria bacterium]|nr:MAG: flagellar motor switch protein FliN [Deltaproteobacteria bacterium]HDG97734.1 flagellar motor switch protein FliN [Desulfobacterales bacterium]
MVDEETTAKEESRGKEGQQGGEEIVSDTGAMELSEIQPDQSSSGDGQGMDFLLDVPLEITVELGRTKIQIGDLLKLGQGSVVELEKMTSEPVEIYVNQKLMAQGEVVVVNEKFGVRLTNIISPGERVKKLA